MVAALQAILWATTALAVLTPALPPDVAVAELGCALRRDAACRALAGFELDGRTAHPDLSRARRLLEGACAGGDAAGCFGLAQFLAGGWGGPPDEARALSLVAARCEAGSSVACGIRARFVLRGVGGPPHPYGALEVGDTACEALGGAACDAGGWVHFGQARVGLAQPYWERACREGYGPGCTYAGHYQWYAEDQRLVALTFYRRACDAERGRGDAPFGLHGSACLAEATHLRVVRRDVEARGRLGPLREAAERLCETTRHAATCALLARWWAIEGDAARAFRFRERAEGAYQDGCRRDPGLCRERDWLLGTWSLETPR